VAADPQDRVVVTVGSVEFRRSLVEARLAEFQPFQLASLGKTPDEVRRGYVERSLAPESLHDQEARRRGLHERPLVRMRIDDALRQALEASIRDRLVKESTIDDAAVKAYWEKHRNRYETPERVRLSRILVASEAEATALLKEVGDVPVVAKWTALARDKSLDKATHLREGNLGFVRPDGQTDAPRVRVDPALYTAAVAVKDGELVKAPVKEGERWAVIWRRGSLSRVERSAEHEAVTIRQILLREKLQAELDRLLKELRARQVSGVDDSQLDLAAPKTLGDVEQRARVAPTGSAVGSDPAPRGAASALR
jgi:peptidyl-prolyl cis-trans isomerase C